MAARLSCAQLLTFCFFVVTAAAAAINITLTVPSGTSNHGNPSLLCTPIQWTDIVVFFLGNYVAHAATVHSFHGESAAMKVLNTFSALLFPGFALFRGLAVISSLAVFGKSELEIAARAGALGVVVRSKDWRPAAGDIVEHAVFRQSPEQTSSHGEKNSTAQLKGIHAWVYIVPWVSSALGASFTSPREVHGAYQVPRGFEIVPVPGEAAVERLDADGASCSMVSNYNRVKTLVALGQTLYGITTLYQARGDQVSKFGYAAFGLTVALYAVMSIINLIGSLFCPEYPEMYLVDSKIMAEARKRGGHFHGLVGRLVEDDNAKIRPLSTDFDLVALDQPVSFHQSDSGHLQMTLEVAPNGPKASETKSTPSARATLINTEAVDKISKASGDAIRPSQSESRTFQLLQPLTDYGRSAGIVDPIVLIPSFNPIRTARANPKTPDNHDLLMETVSWKRSSAEWDVDFTGYIRGVTLRSSASFFLSLLVAASPFAIIGGISHFRQGSSSTLAQRVWIMTWLCFGQGYMLVAPVVHILTSPLRLCLGNLGAQVSAEVIRLTLLGVPAVGGFVVVGQMLKVYGSCTTLA